MERNNESEGTWLRGPFRRLVTAPGLPFAKENEWFSEFLRATQAIFRAIYWILHLLRSLLHLPYGTDVQMAHAPSGES